MGRAFSEREPVAKKLARYHLAKAWDEILVNEGPQSVSGTESKELVGAKRGVPISWDDI